jgi:hypothetical protein
MTAASICSPRPYFRFREVQNLTEKRDHLCRQAEGTPQQRGELLFVLLAELTKRDLLRGASPALKV